MLDVESRRLQTSGGQSSSLGDATHCKVSVLHKVTKSGLAPEGSWRKEAFMRVAALAAPHWL